ncbi:MAG: hypothetical protein K5925_02625 [Bacilli bacterium]|nr:hypothetical protein [Bacilli bacterium]
MFIIAFILTVVLLGLAFLATIGLFLKLSQLPKNIGRKSFSFIYLVVIFVISFAIRFGCICAIASYNFSDESFVEGLYRAINLLYVTGGGLTFEGQDAYELYYLTPLASIFYYGSMLWLASTYIFIISLGLSYELSSKYRLVLRRRKAKFVYVFTSVTEDTLVLANSIEEHHKKDGTEPLIIFAGTDLEPYDKENELHREVMANGYIYQSFYKAKDKSMQMPITVLLGLVSKKEPFESLSKKKIRIFSLENDSKAYGLESKNSNAVFDDIDEMIRVEFFEGKAQRVIEQKELEEFIQKHVNIKVEKERGGDLTKVVDVKEPELIYLDYYLLSNSTINYEFYDNIILEKIRDIISPELLKKQIVIENNKVRFEDSDSPKLSIYTYFRSMFQIHVVNEGYLAGEDLIAKRHEVEVQNILSDLKNSDADGYRYKKFAINRVKIFHEEGEPLEEKIPDIDVPEKVEKYDLSKLSPEQVAEGLEKDYAYVKKIEKIEDEHRFSALILGFGQTGQMAMNNLFVDSTAIRPSLPEKGINLDRYIPSRFVSYVYDLNISQTIGVFTQTHPSYLIKKIIKGDKKTVESPFFNYDGLVEFYGKDYPGHFEEIDELTKFPFVYAFEKNCKDLDFLEAIDGGTGNLKEKTPGKNLSKINAIVVALGSDEENIKVANAILQNIRQELYNSDFSNHPYFYQTIFVNIRDEKNIRRLNWHSGIEAKRHPGVSICPFGNRENMYSYDSIIEDRKYLKINNIYDVLSDYFDEIDPNYSLSGKEKNEKILSPDIRQELLSRIEKKNADEEDSRRRFIRISDYKKSSNKNSANFGEYIATYVNYLGENNIDKYENGILWKYLSFLEHNRWSRYNMSNGYIYSQTFVANIKKHKEKYKVYNEFGYDAKEYSKSLLKLHKCIIPNSYPGMAYLDDSTECYDYGNVVFVSLANKK